MWSLKKEPRREIDLIVSEEVLFLFKHDLHFVRGRDLLRVQLLCDMFPVRYSILTVTLRTYKYPLHWAPLPAQPQYVTA